VKSENSVKVKMKRQFKRDG